MKNCKFCYRPVPSECYVVIRGNLHGKEFRVGDEAEFMCDECADKFEKYDDRPVGLEVGDIVLVEDDNG